MKTLMIFISLLLPSWLWSQKADISLEAVTSMESLSWSIAGNLNGENPNIYSELNWQGVSGIGLKTDGHLSIHRRFRIGLKAGMIWFVAGEVTDTDYQQDNRTNQVFYAREQANDGFSRLIAPMLICQTVDRVRFRLSAGLGYQWISKKFYLLNEHTGLHSSYRAAWMGMSGHISAQYQAGPISVRVTTEYIQVAYDARANWNLIDEFEHPVSFRHEAKGFVWSNEVATSYPIKSNFHLKASVIHTYSSTGKGIDTLYKTDGSKPQTRLNDVTNQVFNISVGVVKTLGQ
ncbi:hypothetical protein [Marinoscillum sp.]|uniref:hypothetical protein n=1 Tax=Marinoscillum sp. TaxID=2024838 RepID=UPI003BABDDD4